MCGCFSNKIPYSDIQRLGQNTSYKHLRDIWRDFEKQAPGDKKTGHV